MTLTIEPQEKAEKPDPIKLSPVKEPVLITRVTGKTTINIFLPEDDEEMVINIMPKGFSGDQGFADFLNELEKEVLKAEPEAK